MAAVVLGPDFSLGCPARVIRPHRKTMLYHLNLWLDVKPPSGCSVWRQRWEACRSIGVNYLLRDTKFTPGLYDVTLRHMGNVSSCRRSACTSKHARVAGVERREIRRVDSEVGG